MFHVKHGCEAPPYKGVQPILVPAAGQRLKISDYPDCFERLFYGQGLPLKRWADETFELPNKPAEVTPDVASDAKLIREFFYDLRDGKLHYKVRKIENRIDHHADAMAYAMQGLKRG